MIRSIAIRRNQHCWGSLNEDFAPPQQHPHGNGYSRHAGCISTIFGHVSFTSVRGTVADGKRTRHRTSFSFQSAAPSPLRSVIAAESSPGGGVTAGSLLPFWRGSRLFQFFPALKVAGDLLFPLRVQPAKQPRGGFTKCFQVLLSFLSHVSEHEAGVIRDVGKSVRETGKFIHERH